jgi:hypothetical protein
MSDATSKPGPSAGGPMPGRHRATGIRAEDFRSGFGEDLTSTLDLGTWQTGRDLGQEYARLELEVGEAVAQETEYARRIREELHPQLSAVADAPPGAGRHEVSLEEVRRIQHGLLFTGHVEAADGISETYDTLPLTIYQIGVGLVSYAGNQGTWQQRLYRRDLRLDNGDPVADMIELLQRRAERTDDRGLHDNLSELASRAILSYGVRAVLARQAAAPWRMGQGSPAPHELLNGGGSTDLMIESLRVIRDLVEVHQRFVFVDRERPNRMLVTVGQGLRVLEYAIVSTLADLLAPFFEHWKPLSQATVDRHWDGEELSPQEWVRRFRDKVASRVVVGVYQATLLGPPRVFYAHVDHAHLAARIAVADSTFAELRGFPMLLDMANQVCRSVYGGGSLAQLAGAAYAAARVPYRFGLH